MSKQSIQYFCQCQQQCPHLHYGKFFKNLSADTLQGLLDKLLHFKAHQLSF